MNPVISLESLDTIADIVDTPTTPNGYVSVDLENMFDSLNFTISCHDDIMRAQAAIKQLRKATNGEVVEMPLVEVAVSADERDKKIPSFVSKVGSEYLMTLDMEILFSFACYVQQPIAKFIKQLSDIPDDGKLNVITELPFRAISYLQIFDGLAVLNMLNTFSFKKVFHMDSNMSLSDLMVAQRCDEIVVGDFASLSITKADNANSFGGNIADTYKYVVKNTYDYWVNKGLITSEEVADLYED